MKKSLFILFLALTAALGMKADLTADWTIHMPFDAWPGQVIETPGRVYFTSRTFEYNAALPGRDVSSNALYYYDKGADEIISMNERVQTSGNAVACIAYNPDKRYLLVVYTDCNIDFIYEDGRIFNLPALKVTSIPGKKEANFINFDSRQNMAYVATTFGYVALNDNKHEVAESRNYGQNVQSVARCGDNIVLCVDGKVYYARASQQRFSLDDYSVIGGDVPEVTCVVPTLKSDFFGFKWGFESYLLRFNHHGNSYECEKLYDDYYIAGIQGVQGGHRLSGNTRLYFLTNEATSPYMARPDEMSRKTVGSYSGTELWYLTERKGLRSFKVNGTDSWTLTRDYMKPNSPATYIATSLYYHPTYGMLAGSNGFDLALSDFSQHTPNNISALKDGFWSEYGPNYASNNPFPATDNFSGLSVDPKNTNHVYRTNTVGGLMRIDLSNPSNIMVFANASNSNSRADGFVKVTDDMASWNLLCRFTPPQFTADGTMWTLFNNRDKSQAEIWYWPASDRLACTGASTYRPMKKIDVPKFPSSNSDVMITLTKNPNIVVIGGLNDEGTLLFYDHNGTPGTTSDDRYVHMTTLYDQDGGSVKFLSINNLYEDPSTGLVWIMSQRGLFTVNPATVFEDPTRVNRIKVARNDGTNLADYLLNEINVHSMSIDGEGRKWFSTSNGLVCTSADGRTILAEFTTDNSYLPSNTVYATCYNEANNSIMVATEGGLVEMFPSGSGNSASSDSQEFRVYPNPVEPDYYGWVRIDNITDGSLVKITDAKGGIVKELGPAQSGAVEWDVSGLNNRRVSTGVYYVMVSPGNSGDGKTQIQKILVLN